MRSLYLLSRRENATWNISIPFTKMPAPVCRMIHSFIFLGLFFFPSTTLLFSPFLYLSVRLLSSCSVSPVPILLILPLPLRSYAPYVCGRGWVVYVWVWLVRRSCLVLGTMQIRFCPLKITLTCTHRMNGIKLPYSHANVHTYSMFYLVK